MLVRLSSNRILNLSDVAEARFTVGRSWPDGGEQLFADVALLSGITSLSACGAEASALLAALRARAEHFAEVGSGRYLNLNAISAANVASSPEPSVHGWWRTSVGRRTEFTVTGEAALVLGKALAGYLGQAFSPYSVTPVSRVNGAAAGDTPDNQRQGS
jgi:hypothetical protein